MKLKSLILALAVTLAIVLLAGATAPPPTGNRYHSPVALAASPDARTLYVADQTKGAVAVVNVASGKVVDWVSVTDPRGLALSADGRTLFVSSGARDEVCAVDTATRQVRLGAATGRQPTGLTLTADGRTLYACNQFGDDVFVYDTEKLARKARLPAVREPRYAALGAGGKLLVVANHLPLGSNLDESMGAEVSLLDLADGKRSTRVQLARGATDVGQVCCSPDGRYAYVVHVLARWLVPPTQLERGWITT
ncbi:MAG: hypothetical protein WCP21_10525, partial [Armatimonadota bacterium]